MGKAMAWELLASLSEQEHPKEFGSILPECYLEQYIQSQPQITSPERLSCSTQTKVNPPPPASVLSHGTLFSQHFSLNGFISSFTH